MAASPLTTEQQDLAMTCYHLVPYVISRLNNYYPVRQLDYNEAMGEGLLALCKAARTFKPDMGVKFSTYAYQAIVSFVVKAARSNRIIHIPGHLHNHRKKKKHLIAAAARVRSVCSLPANFDCDYAGKQPSEPLYDDDEQQILRQAIQRLPTLLAEVLHCRFFDGLTLLKTGQRLGVTRERVRQLQIQALEAAREQLQLLGVE